MSNLLLVKAWSGKWHIFFSEYDVQPAIDGTEPWGSRIPKPERLRVRTTCGEIIAVRSEHKGPVQLLPPRVPGGRRALPRGFRNVCMKCYPIIMEISLEAIVPD